MTTALQGRFVASNAAVLTLIAGAYQVRSFQVVDAPGWLSTERYDITATAGEHVTLGSIGNPDAPVIQMLRGLLADRFRLAAHKESRDMRISTLVLARADRRLGPQLKPSPECDVEVAARVAGTAPRTGAPPTCTLHASPDRLGGFASMDALANSLSTRLQAVVENRTGLSGYYSLDLRFAPDGLAAAPPATADDFRPFLATALREQLGLALQTATGAVEVLVIDQVERPTRN
jgi:uncharacterized protein (TIGR03435 family)